MDGGRIYKIGESLFYHVLAILWSGQYKRENAASLKMDWARIPIPLALDALSSSATLGRRLTDLLLPRRSVASVTAGKLRPELKDLAVPVKPGRATIDPDADLDVTASWGSRSTSGAVMPGQGKVTRNADDPDNAVDVWINKAVCWRNVPRAVWEMKIGGYPVIKKWLSYREKRVLGRALTMDEMLHVTHVSRA